MSKSNLVAFLSFNILVSELSSVFVFSLSNLTRDSAVVVVFSSHSRSLK